MAMLDQSSCLTQWGMLGRCVVDNKPIVRSVELESVRTQVTIRGFVAQVKATLVYHNPSPNPLEIDCVFPVDEGAAVYKFEARLDGRTIIAQCMEKKKAEEVYKEAVSAGKTAMLAREHELTSDILQFALGNLPPESRAEVEVSLVMELSVRTDGGVSFVLPTVLNPRYSPQDLHQKEEPIGLSSGVKRTVYVGKCYSMMVKGSVVGSHQIARVISHTDPVHVNISEDTRSAEVTQDGGFQCDHDWSVIVYYSNPYKTHVLRETADRSGTSIMRDHLLMINLFPELPPDSYSNRNEIIFVIDRSGSMRGEKMQSARSTLLLFLKSLPQGCLFNVVSFGSHFTTLFPEGSREYTETSLSEACRLQQEMGADMGGTEILQPLKSIYSKPPKPEYSRQILLISDGEVWNVEQMTDLVGRHAHDTRVFSVGIGHGASTALIHGVARAGRGRSEMVVQQDMLQQKVMGLVSSMLQESVQGVSVYCQVDPPTRVTLVPKVPPVIFGGQHLVLYARLPPTTTVCEVGVKGSIGGRDAVSASVRGDDIVQVHDEEMSLHRLAARAQINQWQLDGDDEVGEDLIALSLASGVVSRRTALVGVDQESGSSIPRNITSPKMTDEPYRAMRRSFCSGGVGSGCPGASTYLNPALPTGRLAPPSPVSFAMCFVPQSAPKATGRKFCVRRSRKLQGRQACSDDSTLSSHPGFEQAAFGVASPPPQMQESSGASGLLMIVQVQKFDGSWSLEDAAQLCSVTQEKLNHFNPAKSEAVWGTVLVLVLLEKQYQADRDQWKLLATKARGFIASCGEDVQALITSAQAFMDSL